MPPFATEKHTTVVKSDKNLGNRGNNPQIGDTAGKGILSAVCKLRLIVLYVLPFEILPVE